jgi:hypothetical protein
MSVLEGERFDDTLPAVAVAAVAGRKFFRFTSASAPKEAGVLTQSGGYADGVNATETDAAGETFRLVTHGKLLVDSAAAVIALDDFVMSNGSGDAVVYVVAAGNKALGIANTATTGGAGEQVMLRLFKTPISAPTTA